MKEQHLLVDFENVQPGMEDLLKIAPKLTDVWLFHGPNQIKRAEQLKAAHERVTLVPHSGKGKNRDHVYVDFVRDGNLYRSGDAPPPGTRTGNSDDFRLTERWTSSAKSVFLFDVQGSVAKSTHAGIPWVRWLRDEAGGQLHVWPFDGWAVPADKPVLVEVYPSVFRNRYEREGRTADQQDAYATARWMCEMQGRGALLDCFGPPLTLAERAVAGLEGWIFGVR